MIVTKKLINDIAYRIVGCAIEVHRHLGPGLLESVYERCMIQELEQSGLQVQAQFYVPVFYKGKDLGSALKLDLLINSLIIVELKAVEQMIPVYKAQLLSYLKLADKPKGLLINFNTENISSSVVSLVTEKFAQLP